MRTLMKVDLPVLFNDERNAIARADSGDFIEEETFSKFKRKVLNRNHSAEAVKI